MPRFYDVFTGGTHARGMDDAGADIFPAIESAGEPFGRPIGLAVYEA